MAEPSDTSVYDWVSFYDDTLNFFAKGVEFYLGLLQGDLEFLKADPDIKEILDEERLKSLQITTEIRRVQRNLEWLKREIAQASGIVQMSHWTVRFLKATSLLYLQRLKQRRNAIAARSNISRYTLGTLDIRISELEEKTSIGIFAQATPIPLLVDQLLPSVENESAAETEAGLAAVTRPKPIVISSIEVLDAELRSRCLDLYSAFCADGTTDRLDTVLSEATRVLENRIRVKTGLPINCVGLDLASKAFAGSSPMLRISKIFAEQEGAHHLYRGVFGFIRNSVQHQLVSGLLPERVLQVLGLIDYLLFIVDDAAVARNP